MATATYDTIDVPNKIAMDFGDLYPVHQVRARYENWLAESGVH